MIDIIGITTLGCIIVSAVPQYYAKSHNIMCSPTVCPVSCAGGQTKGRYQTHVAFFKEHGVQIFIFNRGRGRLAHQEQKSDWTQIMLETQVCLLKKR